MPPFASSGSHRGESLSLLRRRESPLSSPTPAAPSASATIVPDPRTLDPFPPSLPTAFFSLSLSLSLCRRPFHFDRFSLNYSSHLRRRPSRATSTSTSTSSSSYASTCLRLTTYRETLHLLRAILQCLLHPLFAVVIRVPSRRRGVSVGRFLRGLGRAAGRRSVARLMPGRVTGHWRRRWWRWLQRTVVLLRVFGPLLRLLLLLAN